MNRIPFETGDHVILKSDPQQRGVINRIIDPNADVPYFWVNWPSGIRGHRATELEDPRNRIGAEHSYKGREFHA